MLPETTPEQTMAGVAPDGVVTLSVLPVILVNVPVAPVTVTPETVVNVAVTPVVVVPVSETKVPLVPERVVNVPVGAVTLLPLIKPEEMIPPVEKIPVPSTDKLPETTVLTKTIFVKTPETAEINPACIVSPVITKPLIF